jgi:hypothetical protein
VNLMPRLIWKKATVESKQGIVLADIGATCQCSSERGRVPAHIPWAYSDCPRRLEDDEDVMDG